MTRIEGKSVYSPVVQMTTLKPRDVDIDAILDETDGDIEEFNFDISGHGDDMSHGYEARGDGDINVSSEGSSYIAQFDEDRSNSPVYGGRYSNI